MIWPVPTWRLAVLLAVTAVATAAVPVDQPAGMIVVTAAVLLAGAVDVALAPDPGAVVVQRQFPGAVVLGGTGSLRWRIVNPTDRVARLAIADDLAPSLRASSRRAHVVLGPRAEALVQATVRPTRRGRFLLRELVVRTEGPLRLAGRQRRRPEAGQLRVHPRFRSRDEAELRIKRARLLEVGLRSTRGRGGGTDFDQLREYTDGDESRRIDWAATARSGRPIVRTYRAERNQTVLGLLDTGRLMAGRVDGVPRLEHALDAVFALTTVATRLGDRFGLVAFDHDIRATVSAAAGPDQFGVVLETCFDLDARLVESDYRRGFVEAMTRFRRRSMIVVFTDLVEEAAALHLIPALPLIARSHLVIVAAVRDPAVMAWADAEPDDGASAYRAVAARGALAQRDRTAARLRGLGATVVDAPPDQLAARLADTYLDIKATGSL